LVIVIFTPFRSYEYEFYAEQCSEVKGIDVSKNVHMLHTHNEGLQKTTVINDCKNNKIKNNLKNK